MSDCGSQMKWIEMKRHRHVDLYQRTFPSARLAGRKPDGLDDRTPDLKRTAAGAIDYDFYLRARPPHPGGGGTRFPPAGRIGVA